METQESSLTPMAHSCLRRFEMLCTYHDTNEDFRSAMLQDASVVRIENIHRCLMGSSCKLIFEVSARQAHRVDGRRMESAVGNPTLPCMYAR
jgi:hypothetical protein